MTVLGGQRAGVLPSRSCERWDPVAVGATVPAMAGQGRLRSLLQSLEIAKFAAFRTIHALVAQNLGQGGRGRAPGIEVAAGEGRRIADDRGTPPAPIRRF